MLGPARSCTRGTRPPGGCAGPTRRRSRDHLGRPRQPAPGPTLGCRRPGRRGRPLGRLRLRRHRRRASPGAAPRLPLPRLAEFDHPPGEPRVFRETLSIPAAARRRRDRLGAGGRDAADVSAPRPRDGRGRLRPGFGPLRHQPESSRSSGPQTYQPRSSTPPTTSSSSPTTSASSPASCSASSRSKSRADTSRWRRTRSGWLTSSTAWRLEGFLRRRLNRTGVVAVLRGNTNRNERSASHSPAGVSLAR